MTSQSAKTNYIYKRTVEPRYWQDYLSRELSNEEKFILSEAKKEQMMNKEVEKIYTVGKTHGLYIPALTKLDGNCLFESLRLLGLYEDSQMFRVGLAQLLLILKNVPNFYPGFEEPLGEIFQNFTEFDRVKCSNTGKVYIYNWDAMCVDLSKDTNWTRLNTELIMRLLCLLLNLNIKIYHVNGHITNTNESPNESTLEICLGQIGDASQKRDNGFHYIPLKKLEEGVTEFPKCLTYVTDLTEYHKWARSMAKSLGRITIEK